MSLNAVAHHLVFANRRKKMNGLIAAVGSSFLSSQQHCGVLQNVSRNCEKGRTHMRTILFTLIVFTSMGWYQPCQAQTVSTVSQVVFKGFPTKKDMSDIEGTEQVSLSEKEGVEYRLVITKQGKKYFWESRENRELLTSRSGEFYNFVEPNGAGYIRIAKVEGTFYYMENLSTGFKNITYWGYALECALD